MGPAAWWVIGGGVAQVVGVMLVAWEYVDTRKSVKAYAARARTIYASAGGSEASVSSSATATGTRPAGPPDLIDRVRRLEARADGHDSAFTAIRGDMETQKKQIEQTLQGRIQRALETLERRLADDLAAIDALLIDLNDDRGHLRRIASVLLLVGGVAAATYGGWLAL